MAKYSGTQVATPKAALKTTASATLTHEGAPAWSQDDRTSLFTLAVTSMTGEDTFYEKADVRDDRLRTLVRRMAVTDPEFLQLLVPWLRNKAHMRSAPIVIAAQYALAQGPNRRQVIDSAMARADEPAEFLGYYMAQTNRKTLPAGIQRGVADAVKRLYSPYSALKYDSSRHAVRMGDVIELVHPSSTGNGQGALYQWLLDKRHHSSDVRVAVDVWLPMIHARTLLEEVPQDERRALISADDWDQRAKAAGVTWEYLSGWLPGGMDAEAWEAVIPQMGYMALLRNLRNFDQANVSDETVKAVSARLSDPEEVAASRQLPFRFWSAWNATQSTRWAMPLETALGLSIQNVPTFEGTTLVLVDVSGSMTTLGYSKKGTVRPSDVAALFGAALFGKNSTATRVAVFGTYSKDVTPKQRGSVLRNMEVFRQNHDVGHSTNLADAVRTQYRGEDRIVVFTDMQAHDGGAAGLAKFVHYFDLGGYGNVPDPLTNKTFLYGGFTDQTFKQMTLLEMGRIGDWDSILSMSV